MLKTLKQKNKPWGDIDKFLILVHFTYICFVPAGNELNMLLNCPPVVY